MATEYKKPLPRFYSKYSRAFYDGCKKHELLIQKCSKCGKHRFPPSWDARIAGRLNLRGTNPTERGKYTLSL